MKTTKNNSLLNSLMSQIDRREYEKVKSRMKLSAKIADTLKEKNISQKEFAKALGKKPSEISKWLSGTHNFTHDTLIDIQSILKIELINNHKESKVVTPIRSIEVPITKRQPNTPFISYSNSRKNNIACENSIKIAQYSSCFN